MKAEVYQSQNSTSFFLYSKMLASARVNDFETGAHEI
jgi:hypothetical protein